MKKYPFIVCLNLLYILTCNGQNIDIKNIIGAYKYESRTDISEYVVETIEKDSSILLKTESSSSADGCCSEKWTLRLNNDFTFELKMFNDQGDYNRYNISYGSFVIRHDTLNLYSPILIKTGILEKVNEKLPKSLYKISFLNEGWTMGYLLNYFENLSFYSLNLNFEKTKIHCLYTIPDENKVKTTKGYDDIDVGIVPSNIDTISFVFNRKDIDKYLLIYTRNEQEGSSQLIKMSDYKYNNYYFGFEKVTNANEQLNHEYFIDVSTFKLIIKPNELVSVDKHLNEVGGLTYFRFLRMK